MRPGVGRRSRPAAYAWVAAVGVGLVAVVVGLVVVFRNYEVPSAGDNEPTGVRPGGPSWRSPAGGTGDRAGFGVAPGPGGVPPSSPLPESPPTGPRPSVPEPGPGGERPNAGAAAPPPAPAHRPQVAEPGLVVDIKRVLRGYADETVTYAVGHVTNNGDAVLGSVRVRVDLLTKLDGEKVGTAEVLVLGIPPRCTAPVVAECRHAQGARPRAWMLTDYQINPPGVPEHLPRLEVETAYPLADPNTEKREGVVRAVVINHGQVAVSDLFLMALLLDAKGKIVGAARSRVNHRIEPGRRAEIEIGWQHTAGWLVRNVEVWAQPYFYLQK